MPIQVGLYLYDKIYQRLPKTASSRGAALPDLLEIGAETLRSLLIEVSRLDWLLFVEASFRILGLEWSN